MLQFILGIAGNLIASYIYDRIRGRDASSPPIILLVRSGDPESRPRPSGPGRAPAVDYRALNRQRLSQAIVNILLLIAKFIMLKIALYGPLYFGQGFTDTLDLGKGNLTGLFSTSHVSKSELGSPTTIATIILYFPLLLLGDWILTWVRRIYDKFWPVDFAAVIQMRFWIFFGISILVAGLSTFAVTQLSLVWALLAPIVFVIVAYVIAESS